MFSGLGRRFGFGSLFPAGEGEHPSAEPVELEPELTSSPARPTARELQRNARELDCARPTRAQLEMDDIVWRATPVDGEGEGFGLGASSLVRPRPTISLSPSRSPSTRARPAAPVGSNGPGLRTREEVENARQQKGVHVPDGYPLFRPMARAGYEDEQAAVDGTFLLALEDLKLACKDCALGGGGHGIALKGGVYREKLGKAGIMVSVSRGARRRILCSAAGNPRPARWRAASTRPPSETTTTTTTTKASL
jgi:hypothetical protein